MLTSENQTAGSRRRVVVAMSGGIDSSVAAALLQQQGYDVVGLTLRLYECTDKHNENSCCGIGGAADALAAAGALGIPHYVIDGRELFEQKVLRHAWKDYARGRTPNPCVSCNEWLKFGLLFDHAQKLGAEYVATGHHAQIKRNGTVALHRGVDANKDQSYFLFALTPEQLAMSLLPIGHLTKANVRELARSLKLPNAERKESQDACIAQRDEMAEALRERFQGSARAGEIVDTKGRVLGHHSGIHHFTIGQRKGLGIALGERSYVTEINAETGRIVVSTAKEDLLATGLFATQTRWHLDTIGDIPRRSAQIQIRYRHNAAPGTIVIDRPDSATVWFEEAQAAVTPGQAVVFYDGDRVLGGGWIDRALRN